MFKICFVVNFWKQNVTINRVYNGQRDVFNTKHIDGAEPEVDENRTMHEHVRVALPFVF